MSEATPKPGQLIVYALIDPRTDKIRYIGLSTRGMKRVRDHWLPGSLKLPGHKAAWLRQLKASGLKYEVEILDECQDLEELEYREKWWIKIGRREGWPLTNLTSGGNANCEVATEVRELRSRQAIEQFQREGAREAQSRRIKAHWASLTPEERKAQTARQLANRPPPKPKPARTPKPRPESFASRATAAVRMYGPYHRGDEWRLIAQYEDGSRASAQFPTREEAEAARAMCPETPVGYLPGAREAGAAKAIATRRREGTLAHSPETRKKIGDANRGKVRTLEFREFLSRSRKGRAVSPETAAKISAANRGRKLTPEQCARIGAGNRGKRRTPEQCAAMSAHRKGRPLSPPHAAAVQASHTPESYKKMWETRRRNAGKAA